MDPVRSLVDADQLLAPMDYGQLVDLADELGINAEGHEVAALKALVWKKLFIRPPPTNLLR